MGFLVWVKNDSEFAQSFKSYASRMVNGYYKLTENELQEAVEAYETSLKPLPEIEENKSPTPEPLYTLEENESNTPESIFDLRYIDYFTRGALNNQKKKDGLNALLLLVMVVGLWVILVMVGHRSLFKRPK